MNEYDLVYIVYSVQHTFEKRRGITVLLTVSEGEQIHD